jgi:hypothetical protein
MRSRLQAVIKGYSAASGLMGDQPSEGKGKKMPWLHHIGSSIKRAYRTCTNWMLQLLSPGIQHNKGEL